MQAYKNELRAQANERLQSEMRGQIKLSARETDYFSNELGPEPKITVSPSAEARGKFSPTRK